MAENYEPIPGWYWHEGHDGRVFIGQGPVPEYPEWSPDHDRPKGLLYRPVPEPVDPAEAERVHAEGQAELRSMIEKVKANYMDVPGMADIVDEAERKLDGAPTPGQVYRCGTCGDPLGWSSRGDLVHRGTGVWDHDAVLTGASREALKKARQAQRAEVENYARENN